MFEWLKRKPKIKHHVLKDVSGLPQYSQFYRPVECKTCGKQFIMDVFGGWAIEYKFETGERFKLVTKDSLEDAIRQMHTVPARDWIQLGYNDICQSK